jgi:hypothetical protein
MAAARKIVFRAAARRNISTTRLGESGRAENRRAAGRTAFYLCLTRLARSSSKAFKKNRRAETRMGMARVLLLLLTLLLLAGAVRAQDFLIPDNLMTNVTYDSQPQSRPFISGEWVVYEDTLDGAVRILAKNLETHEMVVIADGADTKYILDVSGGRVLFRREYGKKRPYLIYDLAARTTRAVPVPKYDGVDPGRPSIRGDFVFFSLRSNERGWNTYTYDVRSGRLKELVALRNTLVQIAQGYLGTLFEYPHLLTERGVYNIETDEFDEIRIVNPVGISEGKAYFWSYELNAIAAYDLQSREIVRVDWPGDFGASTPMPFQSVKSRPTLVAGQFAFWSFDGALLIYDMEIGERGVLRDSGARFEFYDNAHAEGNRLVWVSRKNRDSNPPAPETGQSDIFTLDLKQALNLVTLQEKEREVLAASQRNSVTGQSQVELKLTPTMPPTVSTLEPRGMGPGDMFITLLLFLCLYLAWHTKLENSNQNLPSLRTADQLANWGGHATSQKRAVEYARVPSTKTGKEVREEPDEEVNEFFERLRGDPFSGIELPDPPAEPYLSDENFTLFSQFIGNTKRRLDILTHVADGKVLSELLWPLRDKAVHVRLVTSRVKKWQYIAQFSEYCSALKLEPIVKRKWSHAKLLIRDNKRVLVGSSNLDDASLSKGGFFYEANVISQDESALSTAREVFESVLTCKDRRTGEAHGPLVYTGPVRKEFLPLCLRKYFENEPEEIVIAVGAGLIDWKVVDRLKGWAGKTPVRIITSSDLPRGPIREDRLHTLQKLVQYARMPTANFRVEPKQKTIHAKVYLFKGQGITAITSQNLTIDSWQHSFETGYILKDTQKTTQIAKALDGIAGGQMPEIVNDLELADAPDFTWAGTAAEKKARLPWPLPYEDASWRMQKLRGGKYYLLVNAAASEKQGTATPAHVRERSAFTKRTGAPGRGLPAPKAKPDTGHLLDHYLLGQHLQIQRLEKMLRRASSEAEKKAICSEIEQITRAVRESIGEA